MYISEGVWGEGGKRKVLTCGLVVAELKFLVGVKAWEEDDLMQYFFFLT